MSLRQRSRSRAASSYSVGMWIAVSAPARQRTASCPASRRSVLMRSPARRGISAGAITSHGICRPPDTAAIRSRTARLHDSTARDLGAEAAPQAGRASPPPTSWDAGPASGAPAGGPRPASWPHADQTRRWVLDCAMTDFVCGSAKSCRRHRVTLVRCKAEVGPSIWSRESRAADA